MTTTKKNIIIVCAVVFVLAALFTIAILTGKIPMNDPYTVGNTAGNLNNGGLFCESDGRVYFANAYDNNALYSMNADETDVVKLNSNSVASINAGGDYLYYYMESGTNGKGLGFMGRTAGIYRSEKTGRTYPVWTGRLPLPCSYAAIISIIRIITTKRERCLQRSKSINQTRPKLRIM